MATQLFLLDTVADTHLGTNNASLIPANVGWVSKALGTARGSGVVASTSVATVAGTTLGVVVQVGGVAAEWISPPVAADVTISGTITGNIWARESANAANAAINVVIEIIRANATGTLDSNTLVLIVKSTRVTELGASATTNTAQNFTTGMASGGYTGQTLNRGDRLRIRVFADDVGTMGSGQTFTIGYSGTTAAANGDSYVTFTENITFETAPGVIETVARASGNLLGSTLLQQKAQSFVASGDLTEVKAWLTNVGAPTDDVVVEVQTDSSGSPSGSVVGTVATVTAASLTTTTTQYTYSTSISLSVGTTYWLVFRRSGAVSDTDLYSLQDNFNNPSGWVVAKRYNGTAWADLTGTALSVRLAMTPFTLYLTDTASAVATASVDREAWTSRGAGVQTDVRNTAAGWTAPLQLTDTAGGTVVDWFTRPLTAFTLTGMAVANIRAASSSASANDSIRCEIARVEGDGTSPTVWASWCIAPITTDNGELGTSEAARTCNVSGDDLAITNGQRLRIRLYTDDMSAAAMATSFTTTVYYAGTSGGASGDTYLTFPQTLTEFVSSTPGPPQSHRQRRANRFLTSR